MTRNIDNMLEVKDYPVAGVLLLTPRVFGDHRGFFMECYNETRFEAAGVPCKFIQDNHSKSIKNTLRGLHYQVNRAQDKLVRCIQGEIFDVAVDMRPNSPTRGQWVGEILSAENRSQLFVPKGFAHGFQVLSDTAEVIYKCSDIYSPTDERGVMWNDPEVGIQWPGKETPILSDKDQENPLYRDVNFDEI